MKKNELVSLEQYITGLWKLGGMPAALVGLGAVNIFVPYPQSVEVHKVLITGFLFLASLVAWTTITCIAYKRWQHEMNIAAEQDNKVIEVMSQLVTSAKESDTVASRVKTMMDSLEKLGVRTVLPLDEKGASSKP